jgi:hypothetical protein
MSLGSALPARTEKSKHASITPCRQTQSSNRKSTGALAQSHCLTHQPRRIRRQRGLFLLLCAPTIY